MIYETTIRGRVVKVTNAVNSKDGNPQKRVIIENKDGIQFEFLTAPNSQLANSIGNSVYEHYDHTFYVDANGRIGTRP